MMVGSYWVTIDTQRCQSWDQPWKCGACVDRCEHGVFERDDQGHVFVANEEACVGCRICQEMACPNNCIYVRPTMPEADSRGVWTTEAVENVHHKSLTGEYRLRGFGTMRRMPHFEGLTIIPSQLAAEPPLDKYREEFDMRVTIGEGTCSEPLTLGLPFVIAAMSYGAISREGKMAMAAAAARLGIMTNTGEGGMFPGEDLVAHGYWEERGERRMRWSPGGSLAVQWSTGRWGVSREYLQSSDAVEIKVGQGAKPGMGGHLLGKKVTADIASVRGVPVGTDALSPSRHYDIEGLGDLATHVEMLRDITEYRKPIMMKMGPSRPYMDTYHAADAGVDAISIDGMMGGTGASPEVVTQEAGVPTIACIRQAARALKDMGLDGKVKLIALGGIRDGADTYKALAMGADLVGLGSAVQVAMGCRVCMSCHQGGCHYGIATQREEFRGCVDVDRSSSRVANYIRATAEELKILSMLSGHRSLESLGPEDLRALDLDTAAMTGIKLAGYERTFPSSWED